MWIFSCLIYEIIVRRNERNIIRKCIYLFLKKKLGDTEFLL